MSSCKAAEKNSRTFGFWIKSQSGKAEDKGFVIFVLLLDHYYQRGRIIILLIISQPLDSLDFPSYTLII